MDKFNQTIKSFLKKYDLEKSDLTYLVAFSGGFDSMSLLYCLKKSCKNKIIALHLNHKWRGEESDIEEENCKHFASLIGVEIYCENLPNTVAHTETAAREARYEFFERCSKKFDSKIIFTAHNKNDNAETLIYRTCMGTGISGLQGIAEHRGKFYRPLLSISRAEIENYCKKYKLTPNIDSSNIDIKYKRNYIRAKVLPQLLEINPNVVDAIDTLSEVAKEETTIVEEYINFIIEKISENNKIKTKKFLNLSDSVQKRIIYKLFIENNLEYDRKKILKIWDFIKENSTSKSGKTCSLTINLWIFTSDKFIEIIDNKTHKFQQFHITKEGKYENDDYIFEIKKFDKPVIKFPKENENTAYVDLHKLPIDFEIRTRQNGDIIQPFGLNGTQKLKKYLISKNIPNHEKDNLLFFTQENEILWAINLGISDKIKVSSKPTHILTFIKKQRGDNHGN